ncbi:MAG: hypothetical protein JW904_09085 [Spirochaetales bacterium]|nr:hypothetical protein [Spirochaetales bacterium]
MPKIDDLDSLKEIINAMGDEPAIRQERGESIETITPPEQGLTQDLTDLLGIDGGDEPVTEAELPSDGAVDFDTFSLDDFSGGKKTELPESGPDFDALLGGDAGEIFEETGPPREGAGDVPSPDMFDLDSLVGEDTGEPSSDVFPDESSTLDSSELDALLADTVPDEEAVSGESLEMDMPEIAEEESPDLSAFGDFMELPAGNEPVPGDNPAEDDNALLGEGFDEADTASMDTISDFDLPDISEMTSLGGEEISGEQTSEGDAPGEEMFSMDAGDDFLSETPGISEESAAGEETSFSDIELPGDFDFGSIESSGEDTEFSTESAGPAQEGGEAIDIASFDLPDFGGAEEPAGPETEEADTVLPDMDAGMDDSGDTGFEMSDIDGFEMPDISGIDSGSFESDINQPEITGGDAFDREGFGTGAFSSETEGELSFEMPDVGESFEETGAEPSDTGEQLDQFSIDEFALPEMGQDFGLPEAGESKTPEIEMPGVPRPAVKKQGARGFEELSGTGAAIEFSQSQFDRITETLASLPLNVKIIVEELIGEQELSGEPLKQLLDALVQGDSPKEIARILSGITGKKIVLPKSFEKRTGVAFEQERESFAYFLKTKGWKIGLGVAAAVTLLFIIAFGISEYIMKPLSALSLYDEGYQSLLDGKSLYANDKFREAAAIWDSKDQYYRFAEGFVSMNELGYAQKIYHMLLVKYPGDVKGTIDYAKVETLRRNFEHAEQLLVTGIHDEHNILRTEALLMKDMDNFEANIAAADNYLAWAEIDFSKNRDAAQTYDFIAEHFRERPESYLKRVDYLVKIEKIARDKGMVDFDNLNKVLAYRKYFRDKNYSVADPGVYTRLAEYLIDKKEYDDVHELLIKAKELDDKNPLTYFEFARFYHDTGAGDELRALEVATHYFENPARDATNTNAFVLAHEWKYTLEKTAKHILAYNMLGEFYLYSQDASKPEIALQKFTLAQKLFENSGKDLSKTKYAASGDFGKIYYNLGNVFFSSGNYGRALSSFLTAEANNYKDPDQTYKTGYIRYSQNDLDDALVDFHRVLQELPENKPALFALATMEYERGQYAVAQGFYQHLFDILEEEKNEIPGSPEVDRNPTHRDLIFNIFVVSNNLGCAYYRQAVNTGSATAADSYITRALVNLTRSIELFDVVSRDVESMKRLEETTIARVSGRLETVKKNNKDDPARFLVAPRHIRNQDVVMHGKNFDRRNPVDVEIYPSIPYTIHTTQLLPSEFYPLQK